MSCPCGTYWCFLCNEAIVGYAHFQPRGGRLCAGNLFTGQSELAPEITAATLAAFVANESNRKSLSSAAPTPPPPLPAAAAEGGAEGGASAAAAPTTSVAAAAAVAAVGGGLGAVLPAGIPPERPVGPAPE